MEVEKRYLTLQEAQRLLPEIQKSLIKIIEITNALRMSRQISITYTDVFQEVHKEISRNEKYFELNTLLFKELHKLLHMGCIVKDVNAGLVDFFAKHRGREIFLCWRLGENSIEYWHEIDGGFSTRMPVSMLSEI